VTAPLDAVQARVADLARDLGRLRRRLDLDPERSAAFLLERVADDVLGLEAMLGVPASELAREFFCIAGDHELAVEEALRVVDERARLVRHLLRPEARR
jgi:hypothetical protein